MKTSKNRSPLIIFKKRRHALHEIPNPRGIVCRRCFQIQFPICSANFSNNISINQASVNERKNTRLNLWNLLTIKFSFTWSDHKSPCKKSPHKFAQKRLFPMPSFFMTKVPPYFVEGRGDTMLYLHIFSHF